jgi:hypothetical protein
LEDQLQLGGAKDTFLVPFYAKDDHFAKTGSRETQEKWPSKRRFVQASGESHSYNGGGAPKGVLSRDCKTYWNSAVSAHGAENSAPFWNTPFCSNDDHLTKTSSGQT